MQNHKLLLSLLATAALLGGCNTADLKTARRAAASGDTATARATYAELAAYGIPEAQIELAMLTLQGKHTAAEGQAATAMLEQAAVGNPAISMKLGDIYEKGEAVPRNLKLAAKYYLQAFELGSPKAAYKLGNAYMDMTGHDKEALEWLEKSRLAGEPKAALRMGRLYAKRKDTSKALGYYLYAQSHGVDASETIAKLKAKAPAATIAAGENFAKELSTGVSPQVN